MIGAIGSNSNLLDTISSQYSLEAAGQKSGAAPAEKDAPQKTGSDEIKAVYGSYDTVTISAEGAAYARQATTAKVSQDGAATTAKVSDSTVTSAAKVSTDTAVKGAAGTKAEETTSAEAEAASSTEEDDTELWEYSDSELKQMMYRGDITQSEYDEEMLNRNGFTAESEA